MSSSEPLCYGVVVPVKPPGVAKSRLADLGDAVRRDLVTAFAADTVSAALESPAVSLVLVMTDDVFLARDMSDLGAQVIPDGAADNLNASLVQAAAELARRIPGAGLAALCADLPALRTAHLTAALRAAPHNHPSFVADADGAGTTAYLAPGLASFSPGFGKASRAAHRAAGAVEIDLAGVTTLRRDVDTAADLAAAIALGVGAHTSEATAGLTL